MQETKTQPAETADYISLSAVKNAFLDFFAFLFRGVDYIALSIRKNILVFLLCCLTGLALGYSFYLVRPSRYYTSEMIVNHNELYKKDYFEIINNLNSLILSSDYNSLSKKLNLNRETVEKIEGLAAVKINGETLERDTSTKMGLPFKIRVQLKSFVETDQVQQAVIDYLNNSPYLKRKKDGLKKIYGDRLAYIESELRKLDTLKSTYNAALASSKMSATFYNNAMNPADLYDQSLKLANQKEALLKWLNIESESVTLIDGLKTPVLVESLSLRAILITGFMCGIALGVLMCILVAVTKEVQAHRRTRL
jgi:hypothetical protein